MRIYLGGIQGVGKTSIAKMLVAQYPELVHYSTSEVLMKYFGVVERKDLEKISVSQVKRDKIFSQLCKNNPNLILDGHFKLATNDSRFFDFFFFIDAPDKIIIERRQKDKTRQRSISMLLGEERRKELSAAKRFGIDPIIIFNSGDLQKTISEINAVIGTIMEES